MLYMTHSQCLNRSLSTHSQTEGECVQTVPSTHASEVVVKSH